jgi:hypothetical protein
MREHATDVECIQLIRDACEHECTELAARVVEGHATIAELAEAEGQLRRLQALESAVKEKALRRSFA